MLIASILLLSISGATGFLQSSGQGNPVILFSLLALNWFLFLLGVGFATTLYGHHIEGRELT